MAFREVVERPELMAGVEVQNEKAAARPETQRRFEIKVRILEPALFVRDIGVDEIFVAFGEVN